MVQDDIEKECDLMGIPHESTCPECLGSAQFYFILYRGSEHGHSCDVFYAVYRCPHCDKCHSSALQVAVGRDDYNEAAAQALDDWLQELGVVWAEPTQEWDEWYKWKGVL